MKSKSNAWQWSDTEKPKSVAKKSLMTLKIYSNERNQIRRESPANLYSHLFYRTINKFVMTKKLSTAEQRRAKRNAQIIELYQHCKDNFATQLERYLYIAQKVGCSHITVYKVLRQSQKCK